MNYYFETNLGQSTNMSKASYKTLATPILNILDEHSPLPYDYLYKCVKYKASCPQQNTSCEHYTQDGGCSKPSTLCNYFKQKGGCSKPKRKVCTYYTEGGGCSEQGESCTEYKIEVTHSKNTFARCVNYLCFIGEIIKNEGKNINGRRYVSFTRNSCKLLLLDNNFDDDLALNEHLLLSIPPKSSNKRNIEDDNFKQRIIKRYAPTGKLKIEEYEFPIETSSPLKSHLYLKVSNPYFFYFNESIKSDRYLSKELLNAVDRDSPFGFEEHHFKIIVNKVAWLLNELIESLHIFSTTSNRKFALGQYKAIVETHLYPGFSRLTSLVKSPLEMSSETLDLVRKSFDYAYTLILKQEIHRYQNSPQSEGKQVTSILCDEGFSEKGFKNPGLANACSRTTCMEKAELILRILEKSGPIQYHELYNILKIKIGKTISKGTFGKCLDILDFAGLIKRRQIKGHGRGKHIQISLNDVYSYNRNTDFSWYRDELLELFKFGSPCIVDLNHYRIIWIYISFILRLLTSELYVYSTEKPVNSKEKLVKLANNRYEKFLRTQLIPSLMNLTHLVAPPLKMSDGTLSMLRKLTDCARKAINGEVRHSLNDVTETERIQISIELGRLKSLNCPRSIYHNFTPECVALDLERKKLSSRVLKEIRNTELIPQNNFSPILG